MRSRRAFRLLADYAPDHAPQKPTVAEWETWLSENRSYLFFSDQGDYAWYVDPLGEETPNSIRSVAWASPRLPTRSHRGPFLRSL